MEFPDPAINQYAENHTTAESQLLAQLNRETWSKVLMPRMLSGHLQGRVLSTLSQLLRPKAILEVGTYTGYSALCLAEGLQPGGVLHTIDINEELESMVRRYVAEAGLDNTIHLHVGDARHLIPTLEVEWDLVFLDADKENYATYFDLVIDRVRPGGVIVADNVLWSGKVIDPAVSDAETDALRAYNAKVQADPRVNNVLLPIRDGLMVAIKR
jgi:predicted O-methyltransferase YrrM